MLAPDIQPSRLESAKRIILSISDGLESEKAPTGNRYGLVVFKGLGNRVFSPFRGQRRPRRRFKDPFSGYYECLRVLI